MIEPLFHCPLLIRYFFSSHVSFFFLPYSSHLRVRGTMGSNPGAPHVERAVNPGSLNVEPVAGVTARGDADALAEACINFGACLAQLESSTEQSAQTGLASWHLAAAPPSPTQNCGPLPASPTATRFPVPGPILSAICPPGARPLFAQVFTASPPPDLIASPPGNPP